MFAQPTMSLNPLLKGLSNHLLTHSRTQPSVRPRMAAADMGRDADSPQNPSAHSSCWKILLEDRYRSSHPLHMPCGEKCPHSSIGQCRSRADPPARAQKPAYRFRLHNVAARRSAEGDANDRKRNAIAPRHDVIDPSSELLKLAYELLSIVLMLFEKRKAVFQQALELAVLHGRNQRRFERSNDRQMVGNLVLGVSLVKGCAAQFRQLLLLFGRSTG